MREKYSGLDTDEIDTPESVENQAAGVDSGQLLVIDPAYVLENYDEFVRGDHEDITRLGAYISDFGGDGQYDVKVIKNQEGTTRAAIIDFKYGEADPEIEKHIQALNPEAYEGGEGPNKTMKELSQEDNIEEAKEERAKDSAREAASRFHTELKRVLNQN